MSLRNYDLIQEKKSLALNKIQTELYIFLNDSGLCSMDDAAKESRLLREEIDTRLSAIEKIADMETLIQKLTKEAEGENI